MINNIRRTYDIKSIVKKLIYHSLHTNVEIPEFLTERRIKLYTERKEDFNRISEIL